MIEFFFGTACLVALVGVVRAGRHGRCHGPHHGHHGHHGRHGRWGGEGGRFNGRRGGRGRGGFARAAGEVFKRRLDVDPDQEDIVDHALSDLRDSIRDFKEVMTDTREDIAKAFSEEEVDQATLDAVFASHDEAIKKARREMVSAFKQIHAVLEPDQRELATSWIANAQPGWR